MLVVRNGEPLYDAMRLERLTVDEIEEEARMQGLKDLSEVEVGIIEPDGKFSFVKTNGEQHEADEKKAAQ